MTVFIVQLGLLMCVSRGFTDADADVYTRSQYEYYDSFALARCKAHCWNKTDRNMCIKLCLSKPFTKPGLCPKNESILTPFDTVCMETCDEDSQCSALNKCCEHSCGATCQYPEELLSAVGVPDIPEDVKVKTVLKKRSILLEWKAVKSEPNTTIIYLIEERHHIGHNFIDKHLNEWSVCAQSVKNIYTLKNFAKPGRWYQFRVAAVNENGTKGFSINSPTFNIRHKPKPPKAPQNLTVGAFRSDANGSVNCEIHWIPPRSDLPIQQYKVFLSKRLHGVKPLESVLVHQQIVPKEQTKLLLRNLQPNSLYFLQIQAFVQYGKKRLKGQKSELFLNTPNYTNAAAKSVEGLRVQKTLCTHEGMKVRLSWEASNNTKKYAIRLWNGPCFRSNTNIKKCECRKLVTYTKATHYDLADLQSNCKYKFEVKNISNEDLKMNGAAITFTSPYCHDFSRTNKRMRHIN